jgi:hypothetical protein
VSQAAAAADLDHVDQVEVAEIAMQGDKKAAAKKIKQKRKPRKPKAAKSKAKTRTAEELKQDSEGWEMEDSTQMLARLSSKYDLGHDEGCECRRVPDHLLLGISYDNVVAAYGLLGHIKYAMERKQADVEDKLAEAVTDFDKTIDNMLATPGVADDVVITASVDTAKITAVVTDDDLGIPDFLRRHP